jgi:uncharacterized SAM-binding protein YcdF (DUF218 family)
MHPGATPTYLLGALLLPPTSLLLLSLLGLLLMRSRRTLGVVAEPLAGTLEGEPVAMEQLRGAQAIVVLAGGRNRAAPEWGGQTVGIFSLQRLRYGAHLARSTGLPLLVAGGDPERLKLAEATLMQQTLEREFGVTPRWVETGSDTTRENARFSAVILAQEKITRIVLVTDAFHMRRSLAQFRATGLEVVAAPTGFLSRSELLLVNFFPTAESLRISSIALREWLAILRDQVRAAFDT